MFEKTGGLFGWILIFAYAGTLLNYCLKWVNRHFGKKISAAPAGKKVMKGLMLVFVRNHKYFGLATVVFLAAHFAAQFLKFGINITGGIAAVILLIQVLTGVYANIKKKTGKGTWFVIHRITAVLILFAIAVHLIIPNVFQGYSQKTSVSQTTGTADSSELQVFTPDELSVYNGENGNKAYVAYEGVVYDVTDHPKWKDGKHNGQTAGTDLTEEIGKSPHGDSVFKDLEIVGELKQ